MNSNQPFSAWYHPSLLLRIMRTSKTFSEFSLGIEYGAHAIVHNSIGGTDGDMTQWYSPNGIFHL